MCATIELPDGWIADRGPWDELIRLVNEQFPDPFGGDEDEGESEYRDAIIAVLRRRESAYWLGHHRDAPPRELLALKKCDEAAGRCNIRRRE